MLCCPLWRGERVLRRSKSFRNWDNSARIFPKRRPVMAEIRKPIEYSPSWTFFEGKWHDGTVPIMGPRTHAAWLGSVEFDGARAFEGVAPDLDRHVVRANH